MTRITRLWRRTPWLLRMAGALTLLHAALNVVGARDFVSVLSGTPVPAVDPVVAGLVGVSYVLSHFAFVVLVPILVVAALIQVGVVSLARARRRRPAPAPPPSAEPARF